jgi:hypothetical protein
MFGSVLFSRADQKLARGLCKSFFSVKLVVFQDGGGNHTRVQDDHTIILKPLFLSDLSSDSSFKGLAKQ